MVSINKPTEVAKQIEQYLSQDLIFEGIDSKVFQNLMQEFNTSVNLMLAQLPSKSATDITYNYMMSEDEQTQKQWIAKLQERKFLEDVKANCTFVEVVNE